MPHSATGPSVQNAPAIACAAASNDAADAPALDLNDPAIRALPIQTLALAEALLCVRGVESRAAMLR